MPKTFNKTNALSGVEPPFRRVENDLRARLRRGEWAKGAMLPSRRALAHDYGVALQTVERAMSGLLTEGLLRAEGRWGTYVTGASQPGASATPSSAVMPHHGLAVQTAALGLLDTNSLDTHVTRRDELGWIDLIARNAERKFAASGGNTRYFSRFGAEAGRVSVSQALDSLLQEGADALLVIGIFDGTTVRREVVAAMEDLLVPAVYISWENISANIQHVFYDNRIAGTQAAQHLRHGGYRDLFFFAPFIAPWTEERLAGLMQTQPEGVRVFPEFRSTSDYVLDRDTCCESARTMLAICAARPLSLPPVGIVAANDSLAHLILDIAAEVGLKPGTDFGLIGFDDLRLSRLRGLTTLQPPLEALGEQATRMLLNHLNGDKTEMQVCLRSHLLPRASTFYQARPSATSPV